MSPDLPPSGGVTLNSFQHMLLSRWGELEKLEVSIVKIIARILKKKLFSGGDPLIYLLQGVWPWIAFNIIKILSKCGTFQKLEVSIFKNMAKILKPVFRRRPPDLPPSGGLTLNFFQHDKILSMYYCKKLEVSIFKNMARILKKPF